MTCWDDMPFEMKLEVFKYLNKNDRWKFAKCSFTCFQEIVGEEKYIESLDVEGKITIFIIKIDHSFVITFKQIGNSCEIEHHGEFKYRTIGESENMTRRLLADIMVNSGNNLWNLRLCRVPFYYSLESYPRLNTLDITTSSKDQLYICIEIKSLKNLYVNLEIPDYWDLDYELMEVFEKLDVLRINLIFNNDQFIELTQHLKSIECDARNIDPSILAQIVLDSMRSNSRLELSLRNVDVEILNSLKLVPRFLIYRSISYNYSFQDEFVYGLYNSSTREFRFNSQGFFNL